MEVGRTASTRESRSEVVGVGVMAELVRVEVVKVEVAVQLEK